MEHKTIIGEHGSVHYWVAGQGEEGIVFTHGAIMDHGLFRNQIEYFSQKNTVIVWDVPMHGRSRPYKDFSLQLAAIELVRILNAEEIEFVHLVGQSMGGYISQYAARENSERIRSLVAVDSSPLQPSYYSALDNWLLSITPPILRLYPYSSLIRTIANQIAIDQQARRYAFETLKGYSKEEIAFIMDTVYRGVKEYQQEIVLSVPTVIIYGDSDNTGKVRAYSKAWAEREERPLKIISNASHNSNMDNPDEFNKILGEFIENLDK